MSQGISLGGFVDILVTLMLGGSFGPVIVPGFC
jgi:hypothetical protein